MADGIMKKLLEDVASYILLRLPVKFLLRFKCVSKSCYSLVTSTTFINLHLNRITTAKEDFILFKRSFKEDINQYKTILSFLCGEGDDNINPIFPDLDVPTMGANHSIDYDQLIGPCNGLIALMSNLTTVLFNPSTRNYRFLPPCPFNCPRGFYRFIKCVGFGFDAICNDYKVVRLSELYKDDHLGYPIEKVEKVEIYDLCIDSWREANHVDKQFPIMHWLPCSQIFYEGSCHWVAPPEILCFDISTEMFRSLKIPNASGPLYSLIILNKSLTLICYPCHVPATDPTNDFTDIWIMKNYDVYESWIKKYSIRGLPIGTPLAIWKDHMLLFQNTSGCLMSWDVNCNDVKEFNLHGCRKSMRAIIYKESLISVPRGYENSAEVQTF